MRRISLLLALAVSASIVAARPAHAQRDCGDAGNQSAMNRCASEELRKSDARLNTVYRRAMEKLGASDQASLRRAQRAWIAFRDAHCEFEALEFEGGTLGTYLRLTCLDELTRQRIRQLESAVNHRGR